MCSGGARFAARRRQSAAAPASATIADVRGKSFTVVPGATADSTADLGTASTAGSVADSAAGSAAPESSLPLEPAYVPSPYGRRVTVTQGPSTDTPNAGRQDSGKATDELQVPAAMAKRSKGSYRTAGVSGLNIPGAA